VRAAVLLLLAACAHDAPFQPQRYTPDATPFTGSARVTFNPGVDWMPVWLPDGSAIVYSAQRLDRDDYDRCLSLLPADGGTVLRMMCHRVPPADDSTDVLEAAAPVSDGRLAYVRASSPAFLRPLSPLFQALVLASLDDPTDIRVLRTIPYTAPSGQQHQGISQVTWLGDSTLVYLAEAVAYRSPCGGCPPDTLRWGRDIATLSWAGTAITVQVVPATTHASSVGLAASSDTIYFTLNGDSRVYRQALAGGEREVLHDFGAGRIARDVQMLDGRLVAVVDGQVVFHDVAGIGMVQEDRGGDLYLVDIVGGTETPLPVPGYWLRRPRVRASGDRVVAEAYTYAITSTVVGGTAVVDTIVSRIADLWLLDLP
jgi:hypothetical protein